MKYLVTILEQTPTEDKTDRNLYQREFENLFEISRFLENFELNFGCLLSLSIIPLK